MDADTYNCLAGRYLGRGLEPSDGISEADVQRAEIRLGLRLPAAIKEYYLLCGRIPRFNGAHNFIRSLDSIAVEDAHLVLMDENQGVVSWGIRLEDLGESDPVVWQRNNSPPVGWYSEGKTWPELLDSMFTWYSESGIWELPYNPQDPTHGTRA